jgi:membrane fusion protein (multidrug efflux system)
MPQKISRTRVLRIVLVLTVMVLGAAAGGLYIYNAAAEQATTDTTQSEDTSGETKTDDDPSDGEDEETAIPVSVTDVEIGDVSTYITATSNLVPEDEVRVLAESEARVTRILVEEGEPVRAGQLLAELQRDEAEILVNKARLAYERAQRMSQENLIAQEEFDKITMNHRIAQQELAEAEWRLEKTQIRAPFEGRVTLRSCTLGQDVRPGDPLFTVTDFHPLISRIYLPEKDVLRLDEGRDVRITLNADDEVAFAGRIRQISPVVDTATGTVKVTIEAVDPPSAVRPGGFVAIDITRETHPDAMLLPKEAVIRELKQAHVFVARGEVAEKREVALGLEEGRNIEIVHGLERGESIVIAGQGGLDDGSKIKILPEPAEAQAANLNEDADQPSEG